MGDGEFLVSVLREKWMCLVGMCDGSHMCLDWGKMDEEKLGFTLALHSTTPLTLKVKKGVNDGILNPASSLDTHATHSPPFSY